MKKAVMLLATASSTMGCACAMEAGNGVEISGYMRGGPTLQAGTGNWLRGGYTLGGDLQKYRLGNEGDMGADILLAKTFEVDDGLRYKLAYHGAKWNGDPVDTLQAYAEMSGLDFSPKMRFWAGQRRLRVQDVNIVSHWLMNSGEYQGAGFMDLPLGPLRLGATLSSADRFDRKVVRGGSASKINLDIDGFEPNPGGSVRLLLTHVSSSGFGSNGGHGVSMVHNQKDLFTPSLKGSLFLQSSQGLARITGEFLGGHTLLAGSSSPATNSRGQAASQIYGVDARRAAYALEWQKGTFGGMTLLGYQTQRPVNTGATTQDYSLGGRLSYAWGRHFKLLFEGGATARDTDNGRPRQVLNKITLAPTLSLGPELKSRPELRFYMTYAEWNDTAAAANLGKPDAIGFASTDGVRADLRSQTLVGVQFEASF